MSHACSHCTNGTVKGNGRNYGDHKCPDCEGTGQVAHCENCGEQIPSNEDLCADCENVKQKGFK